MRIGIVNDVALAIEALRRVVIERGGHELAWVARTGEEAVQNCAADTPDLVLMDLVMPGINGAEATQQIMTNSPCAVLVVTASVDTHSDLVYAAMGYGALDAAVTPTLEPDGKTQGGRSLLHKIEGIGHILGKSSPVRGSGYTLPPMPPRTVSVASLPPLLAIGASTGGPQAVCNILAALDRSFPAAIVIVQHVDADFATGFADWLDQRTSLPVRVAQSGDMPQAGQALVAGRNQHLRFQPAAKLMYTDEPTHLINRPSVDVLFKSAAENWTAGGVGLLLTGMGRDGAEGLLSLRQKGWHTIAQDEASSIVFGMPKAAIALDAASEVLPLDVIARALQSRLPVAG